MIFGIGTDIVCVERMQSSLLKHGEKFARRILTDDELDDFKISANQSHFLAKRFAAKEATVKAMGLGFSQGLSLRHIGVGHDDNGKPILEYYERAIELYEELGIGNSYISIADEKDHAVAFVTLETR